MSSKAAAKAMEIKRDKIAKEMWEAYQKYI
jgi:hypothetical protein